MRGRINTNASLWDRVSFISIDDLRMHVYLRSGETIAYSFVNEEQLSDYLKDLLEVESFRDATPHFQMGDHFDKLQPHTSI